MNVEEFRDYCLAKKAVEETFPFDESTLVFKVMGKMFALTGLDSPEFRVNLKCDPEKAVELREEYPDCVFPGYHMSKKHWNTIVVQQAPSHQLMLDWIDNSYDLIVASLKKADREALKEM